MARRIDSKAAAKKWEASPEWKALSKWKEAYDERWRAGGETNRGFAMLNALQWAKKNPREAAAKIIINKDRLMQAAMSRGDTDFADRMLFEIGEAWGVIKSRWKSLGRRLTRKERRKAVKDDFDALSTKLSLKKRYASLADKYGLTVEQIRTLIRPPRSKLNVGVSRNSQP